MELIKGDYVSTIWCCESDYSKWNVWLIKKQVNWEIVILWNTKYKMNTGVWGRPLYRRILSGLLPEDLAMARVEDLVAALEIQKHGTRISTFEVKSKDPSTIIDRMYESALSNEEISLRIIFYDFLQKL